MWLCVWSLQVREALGGKAKLVVSGGSALAKYLENFYQAAGIQVQPSPF
jgi:long-subunit acyl-CoA synthetase (AMP-forming)